MEATSEDAAASFDPHRRTLTRVAYRMLGSVADAEDIVQEAFIRWMEAARTEVHEPAALGKVAVIYSDRNPDKLRHLHEAVNPSAANDRDGRSG